MMKKSILAVLIFLRISFIPGVYGQPHRTYDYQANAERLYNRGRQDLAYQRTIAEMAYYEKITYADRNIFMVHGAHYNPLHVQNMAKVFEQENITGNTSQWLFLIEGVTENSANYSQYAEIEYAAQSAQAWQIPIENIIPYYNTPQVFQELAQAVGSEKAIFFLVMFGMQTGDIRFVEGKGYDEGRIRSTITQYIQYCQTKNIPFSMDRLNALFPINDEKYEKTAEECWDIHQDIRNRIAEENLQQIFIRYPNVKNILVYCGSDHASVFRP